MNKKGFTLVELLVSIVILGIITGMTWPAIRRIQEENTYRKYTNYGAIMVSAAKLYVNSYEQDLFIYDDDLDNLTPAQRSEYQNKGQLMSGNRQCVFVTFQDLSDHALIKDINMENVSCNSNYSFVRIIKSGKKYRYKYYLGCGHRKSLSTTTLADSKVDFTLPNRSSALPLQGHYAERCAD